jgi:hypothetical protein
MQIARWLWNEREQRYNYQDDADSEYILAPFPELIVLALGFTRPSINALLHGQPITMDVDNWQKTKTKNGHRDGSACIN